VSTRQFLAMVSSDFAECEVRGTMLMLVTEGLTLIYFVRLEFAQ
jgi:hypothetical protein